MKYLCLVYGEEKAIQSMDDRHCLDYDESVRASGHCVASEALQPVATATTVRVRNGKVSVTDGPFAETKELVAGYTIINVKSPEEAKQWALKFPNPTIDGSDCEVEVRRFFELEDFQPSAQIERFKEMRSSSAK